MWIIPADAKKPADDRAFHVVQKKEKAVKPFLKWAGGKGQLLPEIERYYPFDDKAITRYALLVEELFCLIFLGNII